MSAPLPSFSVRNWLLLTLAGWTIGLVLSLEIAKVAWAAKMEGEWVVGTGLALGVGLLQWIYLHERLANSVHWLWTTTVGMALPWLAADELSSISDVTPNVRVFAATMVGACLMGWLQWCFVLRASGTPKWGWLMYSLAGWTMAALTLCLVFYDEEISAIIWRKGWLIMPAYFSGAAVLGWLTGIKLKTLLSIMPVDESRQTGELPDGDNA